jgi:hypothetical protein
VKVDDRIEPLASKAPGEAEVVCQTTQPARPFHDDDLVEMWVVAHNRRRSGLDQIGQRCVGEPPSYPCNHRCGEDDVADETKPNEEDFARRRLASAALGR